MGISSTHLPLKGSERPKSKHSRLINPLADHEELSVTFVLRTRPDGPPLPDLEYWRNTPPGRRTFLSAAEFAEQYGAAKEDLDAVTRYAESHHLRIEDVQQATAVVIARGTAANINAAFSIQLNQYESPLHVSKRPIREADGYKRQAAPRTHIHRSFEGQVHLPVELHGIVKAVFGLDNRTLGSLNGTGDPPGSGALSVPQIAQFYNFPTTGAANQTIGIFNGNANYDPKDVATYINSLPSGYNTQPASIIEVDVVVDGTAVTNNVSAVTGSSNADLEIAQDIQTAVTIAQGATVQVYCTKSNEDGWLAFINRIISPQAGETTPVVVSSSWFINAQDDSGTAGQGLLDTISGAFAKLAPLGVSVFIACGDGGANSGIDSKCHVQYPGSDPWITSCGGTMMGVNSGPPKTFVEWVWSDDSSGFGATGGGVSDYFDQPGYQYAAGVAQASKNDGKVRRGLPDIAGMVSLSGLVVSGGSFGFIGTSCVDPLYAGLTAVLAESLGEPIGFLNPTLYALGNSVCNDITTGNNDPNASPDSPYYTAGSGWDACTGWGSIDGTKLLTAFKRLYQKSCSFIMDRSTFGKDEVDVVANYNPAFWVLVQGFRPSELGLNTANLGSPPILPAISFTLDSSLTFAQATAINNMLTVSTFSGPVVPQNPAMPNLPQGFLFPFNINFTGDQGFVELKNGTPSINTTLVTLNASISAAGNSLTGTAQIELGNFEDPYFIDVNPVDPAQPAWLSFDLRFFKMPVPPGQTSSRFGASITGAGDAPGFIANVISNLTQQGGSVAGDTFESGLSQDEDASSLEFQQQDNNGNFVYNFAIARVRLLGKTPGAQAQKVRVFFRLFQAQTASSDFNTGTTYRYNSDGLSYGVTVPLMGIQNDESGNPEYVTIPCFATPRNNVSGAADMRLQPEDTPNAYTITVNPGIEVDSYFGCWLDINQPQQKFLPASPPAGNEDGPWTSLWTSNPTALQSVQAAITAAPHQCLIAEIRFDDTPIPAGANAANSDKLAQRNIAWIDGPNPGIVASRRMSHPVQLKPTSFKSVNPDEVMILWGNTPAGSNAELYLPALPASNIIQMANALYPNHQLKLIDAHTLSFPAGGLSLIPLPEGAALAAGLLAVDLPPGITKGDVYNIIIRQVTDVREPGVTRINGNENDRLFGADDNDEIIWRRVGGAFLFTITISTKQQLLLPEKRLLALMRWIWEHMPVKKRWYPVLKRYIDDIAGRVGGFGGDPTKIPPSETGLVPGFTFPVRHQQHGHDNCDTTGKITGILFDHFGDFEGFIMEDECGRHHRFNSRERPMLLIIQKAWEERYRVRVFFNHDKIYIPLQIELLIGGIN
jgi:hypothetical protein